VTLDYFPVLAYHKISPQKEFGLTTITPAIFEKQIKIIQQSGFTPITFGELKSQSEFPQNPLIITFDDGYESVYRYALPVLVKYNIKVVIYVLSDFIGQINIWEAYKIQRRFRHLSTQQIREMVKLGIEIGSHGKKHSYLPNLNDKELHDEIMISKTKLSDIAGDEIISYCYPYGVSNRKIEEVVKKCNYKFAVGNLDLGQLKHHRQYSIGRRSIYSTDTERSFIEKLKKPVLTDTSLFTEKIIRFGANAAIIRKYLNK
jgi:peptidoglycan/xylan/chitin deacetylase (PgdA/CDA1 family)